MGIDTDDNIPTIFIETNLSQIKGNAMCSSYLLGIFLIIKVVRVSSPLKILSKSS